MGSRPQVAWITGPMFSGKTTCIMNLIRDCIGKEINLIQIDGIDR